MRMKNKKGNLANMLVTVCCEKYRINVLVTILPVHSNNFKFDTSSTTRGRFLLLGNRKNFDKILYLDTLREGSTM